MMRESGDRQAEFCCGQRPWRAGSETFGSPCGPFRTEQLAGVAAGVSAVMVDVAAVDDRDGQHDEHVGGAELVVYDRLLPDMGAEPLNPLASSHGNPFAFNLL